MERTLQTRLTPRDELVEAVAQGRVGAMGVLAEVYEGGCGVERDEEKAAELRGKGEGV